MSGTLRLTVVEEVTRKHGETFAEASAPIPEAFQETSVAGVAA